jgi:hypothetical protein
MISPTAAPFGSAADALPARAFAAQASGGPARFAAALAPSRFIRPSCCPSAARLRSPSCGATAVRRPGQSTTSRSSDRRGASRWRRDRREPGLPRRGELAHSRPDVAALSERPQTRNRWTSSWTRLRKTAEVVARYLRRGIATGAPAQCIRMCSYSASRAHGLSERLVRSARASHYSCLGLRQGRL